MPTIINSNQIKIRKQPKTPKMTSLMRPQLRSAFAIIILITACGGGGGPATTPVSYVGNWYQAELDIYLVIEANHQATIRKCSSSGYKITAQGSGSTNGDALILPDGTTTMARNGDSLTVDGLNFALASAPPTVCSGNFVEITSLTPANAEAGTPSLFTINFVYQLATKSTGIIEIGFNTTAADTPELETVSLPVNQGSGSGSLQATVSPILYPAPDHFEVSTYLSETAHLDEWTPLGSDTKIIDVSTPVVTVMKLALQKNQQSKYACKHLVWKNICSNLAR